jgi:phenylalanyl-tRNA synthetase beta chain
MRRHPLEGILSVVAFNLRHRQPDLSLFEIGRTYGRGAGGLRESRWAVVAASGARQRGAWWESPGNADVYDAKGYAEHVLAALGIRSREVRPVAAPGLEPDATAALVVEGQTAAIFGEVAAAARERLGVAAPVFAALIPLDLAARLPRAAARYEALPRYPSVTRDVAFILGADQALTAQAIEVAMAAEAGPLLRGMTLFDVFRFPDGRRSLAWRLIFQAGDRTLTDDEVNAAHARMVQRVCDHLHISLRGT